MAAAEHSSEERPIVRVLRWVAVLPGALLAGWVGWLLIGFGNRLSFSMTGLDPDGFLSRIFIEGVSHGAIGAAGVYFGALIAPTARHVVVFVLAGIFILLGGFLLFPAILTKNWWAIYAVVALAFGAGAVAFSVYTGETSFE